MIRRLVRIDPDDTNPEPEPQEGHLVRFTLMHKAAKEGDPDITLFQHVLVSPVKVRRDAVYLKLDLFHVPDMEER